MQHSRAVTADILAEEEDAIGLVEIIESYCPDRHANTLGQRHRRALVTHVGGVG